VIKRSWVLGILFASSINVLCQVVPEATAGSAPLSVGGYFSYYNAGYASNKLTGLGAYVDWSPWMSGNVGIEGEGRWLVYGGSHGLSEYQYLVGPRYRFYLNDRYQPYAKMLVGAGELNFPYGLAHGSYFALAPGGGIDVVLNQHWKVRADYEYQFWPNSIGIPGIATGSAKPNGVSVGFSYRLFRSRREW
jgi:opacity protein-like surface antigen